MSNPVCSIASLNLACFRGQVINQHQRKALMVFFKASELNAIGGTNYLNGLISPAAGGLIGDTVALFDEKSSKDNIGCRHVGTFELAVARNTAVAAGVADANIQIRMQSIKCLYNVGENMLERMILFLDCQLGVHKQYPQ